MQAAQDSFISSTYWTEGVGPDGGLGHGAENAASDVPGHMAAIGPQLREGLHGLPPEKACR